MKPQDLKASTAERWLRADMHSHCSLDPVDYRLCPHSPEELIAEAARVGLDVLAITCHDLDVWNRDLDEYAASLGVTLVPGMEVSTEGRRHTLVYNFHTGSENLNTLEKIRARSRPDTLVVAAHPYFPGEMCLGKLVEANIDVFDGIEVSGFWMRGVDFNRRARKTAAAHGKALVGNGDVHYLWQLGRTVTWIHAEPSVPAIIAAVKQGRVRHETAPLGYHEVARWWTTTFYRYLFPVNARPTAGRTRPLADEA